MLDTPVAFSVVNVQEPARAALAYFRKRRAVCIRAYRRAEYVVQRKDARSNALHYSKLVRMMEGRL